VIFSAVLVAGAPPASAQGIDTILVNGKILTVDPQFSVRSALAVREGRIVALGSDPDIRGLRSRRRARLISRDGRSSPG